MHEEIVGFLEGAVAGCRAQVRTAETGDISVVVDSESILPVCRALKESRWDFRVLEVVSGVDWPEAIEVNYMLRSFSRLHGLIVKTSLAKGGGSLELESVTDVWSAADWQERECYDLLGITFRGHPDLRRILCPEDWEGHPLRKDYITQDEYHGMKVDPEEKINTEDHLFCANLKKTVDDPSRISGSWKSDEAEEVQE